MRSTMRIPRFPRTAAHAAAFSWLAFAAPALAQVSSAGQPDSLLPVHTFLYLNFGTLTATGSSSASTALPISGSGSAVVLTNYGTTLVSCTPATGTAVAQRNNIPVPPNGGQAAFEVGNYDHVACIDQGGSDSTSNLIALAGGTGLFAGGGGGVSSGGGGGGGGGGLSVTDAAPWTYASSQFTPSGGEYNPAATLLTSGQQGTVALTAARAFEVDAVSGSNLANLLATMNASLTAAEPCLNATNYNTNSYTTGQTNPATCDLNGGRYTNTGLNRVGGANISLGQAAAGSSLPIVEAQDIRPASGTITAQDVASTSTAGQYGASIITGAPTANSTYSQAVNGLSTVKVQITGTWTGTLEADQSVDGGTTWVVMPCHVDGTTFVANTVTANAVLNCLAAGATNVRMRATAAWTGTATVQATFTRTPGPVRVLTSETPSTNYHLIAANTNNCTNLKQTAGKLEDTQTGNINASTAYFLRFYDKASTPVPSTDSALVFKTVLIPPANSANNQIFPIGKQFLNGLGFCITAAIADNDASSVPASTIIADISYK